MLNTETKFYQMKVLLKRLYLNGNTIGIHTLTQKLEPPCTVYLINVPLSSFHLNGHTLGFHLQTQKLEPPCTA